ncbi:hypothetical protein DFJ58DRAFT_653127, partial [Suillus subalutaceus]|uniref:uncharacterized protein n=1 Tax=Suillus subalutaceus TaxID=48586 RepID=UPI001B860157
LRLKARNEGNLMEECFDRSREAFACHNGALARQLSLDGEAHKANMERLDEAASTKIFQGMRLMNGVPDTVELHGLFVSEAKSYFSNAVRRARDSGESPLYVIVGRGNHSENNIPRIKPEIQEYGRSLGLGVEVDPHNDGRLIVSLNSS